MTTENATEATDVKRRWGIAIKQQREYRRMTQQKLAEAVGVDQTTVSSWERGIKAPGLENQLAIARALAVDARLIFSFPDTTAA